MKDMLLTYNEYNQDLGYVQGMSDLLAPIYAVMQDDAVAFWGFVGFMDRMVSCITYIHLAVFERQIYILPYLFKYLHSLFRRGTSSVTNRECDNNY